jgi:hypothetical protein
MMPLKKIRTSLRAIVFCLLCQWVTSPAHGSCTGDFGGKAEAPEYATFVPEWDIKTSATDLGDSFASLESQVQLTRFLDDALRADGTSASIIKNSHNQVYGVAFIETADGARLKIFSPSEKGGSTMMFNRKAIPAAQQAIQLYRNRSPQVARAPIVRIFNPKAGHYVVRIGADPVDPSRAYYYGDEDGLARFESHLRDKDPAFKFLEGEQSGEYLSYYDIKSEASEGTLTIRIERRAFYFKGFEDEAQTYDLILEEQLGRIATRRNEEVFFGPSTASDPAPHPATSLHSSFHSTAEAKAALVGSGGNDNLTGKSTYGVPESDFLLSLRHPNYPRLKHSSTPISGGGYRESTSLEIEWQIDGSPFMTPFLKGMKAELAKAGSPGAVIKSPTGTAYLVWREHSSGGFIITYPVDTFAVFADEASAQAYARTLR